MLLLHLIETPATQHFMTHAGPPGAEGAYPNLLAVR